MGHSKLCRELQLLSPSDRRQHTPRSILLYAASLFYCSVRSQLLAINLIAGIKFCVLSEHLPVMLQELCTLNLPKHAPSKTLRFFYLIVRIPVAICPGFITDSTEQNPS